MERTSYNKTGNMSLTEVWRKGRQEVAREHESDMTSWRNTDKHDKRGERRIKHKEGNQTHSGQRHKGESNNQGTKQGI